MVTIQIDGKDVAAKTCGLKESLFLPCSEAWCVASYAIFGPATVKTDTGSSKVCATRWELVGNNFIKTTFVPEKYVESLKKSFSPIKGVYDIKAILKKYGFQLAYIGTFPAKYIEIPKLKYTNLMDWLPTKVTSAGGVFMTMMIDGQILIVDMDFVYNKEPVVSIPGTAISNVGSVFWSNYVHGKYNIIQHKDGEKYTNTLEIEKKFGLATLEEITTNDKLAYQLELEAQNMYNRSKYTSVKTVMDTKGVSIPVSVGSCADIMQLHPKSKDIKGVVTEVEACQGSNELVTISFPVL